MKSSQYEQILTSEGVKWTYVAKVPLNEINTTKSLNNQARLEAVIDDLVDKYEVMDKEGLEAPALVGYRPTPRANYVLIDGVQRLTMKTRRGHKTTDMYVVENTDVQVIDRLTWRFNDLVNGRPLEFAERMDRAVTYCRRYGVPATESARLFGLKSNYISIRVKEEEARDLLKANNVKLTPSFDGEKVRALCPLIVAGEDLFCGAAAAVAATGATVEDADHLAKKVKAAPTSEAKAKVIHEFATSPRMEARKAETRGGKTKVRADTPRHRLFRLARELSSLLESYDWTALEPGPAEYKELKEMFALIIKRGVRGFNLRSEVLQDVPQAGKKGVS